MRKPFLAILCVCMALLLLGCSLTRYSSMDAEEMLKLSDDNLVIGLVLQLGTKDFSELNESQKVVYAAASLEMQVRNDGLVHFLSNECKGAAPYICVALETLGAAEHLALLQADLTKNKVDLTDLSVFDTSELDAFSKLNELYDFSDLEGSYKSLPSLPQYIRAYMQAHLEDF